MTSTDFMIYLGIAIGVIIFQYFLLRWVFDIAKRNRYLKAQTELLSKMAEKQGVSKEDISVIITTAERWEIK